MEEEPLTIVGGFRVSLFGQSKLPFISEFGIGHVYRSESATRLPLWSCLTPGRYVAKEPFQEQHTFPRMSSEGFLPSHYVIAR